MAYAYILGLGSLKDDASGWALDAFGALCGATPMVSSMTYLIYQPII